MVNVTKYNGAFIVEYFSDEQWELLNGRAKNEQEEIERKKLVNDRFDAFLQIKKCSKDESFKR